MTLDEFVERLKKLQEEGKGSYEVRVQFNDGVFPGFDGNVEPYLEEQKKLVIF